MTSKPMPILFLGHGSPMNAIAHNAYTKMLSDLGKKLPKPRAILCISAHWVTKGTWVTHMEKPKTIHDFYGFPKELFAVQYPALGSPAFAEKVIQEIEDPKIAKDDDQWGLDHGTWSVLKHIYPTAEIPVFQLSLNMTQGPQFHFTLGKKLQFLREREVLILGSGNIVHNLRKIDWDEDAAPAAWAVEFDLWVKQNLEKHVFEPLVSDYLKFEAGKLSIPTPDHYYPLLYILGAAYENEKCSTLFEGMQNASISMRCLQFG